MGRMVLGVRDTGIEAALSGGVMKIWDAKRACVLAAREPAKLQALENILYDRESKELGEEQANRRAMVRQNRQRMELMFARGELPLWRLVSGLLPEMDIRAMHPEERFWRLSRLVRAVERVLRFEWRAFERKRTGTGNRRQKADGSGEEGGRLKAESQRFDRAVGFGGDGAGSDPLTPDSLRSSRPSPPQGERDGNGASRGTRLNGCMDRRHG